MNTKRSIALGLGLILVLCLWVVGQPTFAPPSSTGGAAPAAAPASATTTAAPRHVATPPPGLHALKVGNRTIFCEAADDAWVKSAIANLKPATRPTTMPTDMIAAVQQRGPEVTKEILADFASSDAKPVNDMLNTLLGQLKKLDTLAPTVCYMPMTRKKLNDALRAGWIDPRFRYVPVADQFQYDQGIKVSLDGPMDDQVIWMDVAETQSADQKMQKMVNTVDDFEDRYIAAESLLSQVETRNSIVTLIAKEYMEPLKLPTPLQWFSNAVPEVYSLKYTSVLSGVPRAAMIEGLLREDPRNPIVPRSIDLMNPMDISVLRPEYVQAYVQAAVRKGSFVIVDWTKQGGDGVLSKTLPSLRAIPATTPAELVKRIKDSSGIDLTKQLGPG